MPIMWLVGPTWSHFAQVSWLIGTGIVLFTAMTIYGADKGGSGIHTFRCAHADITNNTDVRWDYNVYPVAQNIQTGPHDLVADQLFVKVRPDLREADVRLQKGSPARDSGTDELAQATDLAGKKRPAGKARDRGAYEQ
ncbi:MAG: hypothetical protein H7067_04285 [Burkholderiales bacterium]|nr:hypothetical protein [Opitutaceae bacterium]